MSLLRNVLRHSTSWVFIFGVCTGRFDGSLSPLGNGKKTLKDRVLPMDKISYLFEREHLILHTTRKMISLTKMMRVL